MIFNFERRSSDSPFIETIWHNYCESGGSFISMANGHWGMVVTKHNDKTFLTVRGPESKATPAYSPPGAEHFGVYFKLGTFMPYLPVSQLRDGAITLPEAAGKSFWLNGISWQYPEYENLEIFINRLAHGGLLVREPVVNAALNGDRAELSLRSTQRRFLRATGLTHGVVNQIERARQATILLQHGVSILDAVFEAGYSYQPHLTRSLKYFVGLTPAQLIRERESTQLSILFPSS